MKLSIVYFSKTGRTKAMAQIIADGMKKVPDIEVGLFDIKQIDYPYLYESKAIVFGTPTYYANACWQIHRWFDESWSHNLEGKIGAAFATADNVQGGADVAIAAMIDYMMVKGMLVYSGGSALGKPFIHLGAVALKETLTQSKPLFDTFGERIAMKAVDLFSL